MANIFRTTLGELKRLAPMDSALNSGKDSLRFIIVNYIYLVILYGWKPTLPEIAHARRNTIFIIFTTRVSAQMLLGHFILILFWYDVIFYDHRLITIK